MSVQWEALNSLKSEEQERREGKRQRHREREKQALCREPDVGLDPHTPGSRPELKAMFNH